MNCEYNITTNPKGSTQWTKHLQRFCFGYFDLAVTSKTAVCPLKHRTKWCFVNFIADTKVPYVLNLKGLVLQADFPSFFFFFSFFLTPTHPFETPNTQLVSGSLHKTAKLHLISNSVWAVTHCQSVDCIKSSVSQSWKVCFAISGIHVKARLRFFFFFF